MSYGAASGEIEGCPEWYPDLTVGNDLDEETYGTFDTDSRSGFCYASASTQHFFVPYSSPDGDFYSRGTVPSNCVETPRQTIEKFRALLEYSGQIGGALPYKWVKNTAYCNGKCQPATWCTSNRYGSTNNWLIMDGMKRSGPLASFCQITSFVGIAEATPSMCIQRFGIYLGVSNRPSPPSLSPSMASCGG
jgi:hypothetical protein